MRTYEYTATDSGGGYVTLIGISAHVDLPTEGDAIAAANAWLADESMLRSDQAQAVVRWYNEVT
jgi:hypothetical protein